MSKMRTLAIIPARGQSKRVPRKNLRDFLGVPLVSWTIRFAVKYPRFDRVIVSTDSEEIAAVSRLEGGEVPYLRPAELATDVAGSAETAINVLDQEAEMGRVYDAVALLQPTSPVRLAKRWDEAYDLLGRAAHDAIVGVGPVKDHPFHSFSRGEDGSLTRFVSAADLMLRGQDLPVVHAVIGNLYLIRTAALRRDGTFFPPKTAGVVCDAPMEAVDIDTEDDWNLAEALAKHYGISS